jgi:hypothetical protein
LFPLDTTDLSAYQTTRRGLNDRRSIFRSFCNLQVASRPTPIFMRNVRPASTMARYSQVHAVRSQAVARHRERHDSRQGMGGGDTRCSCSLRSQVEPSKCPDPGQEPREEEISKHLCPTSRSYTSSVRCLHLVRTLGMAGSWPPRQARPRNLLRGREPHPFDKLRRA